MRKTVCVLTALCLFIGYGESYAKKSRRNLKRFYPAKILKKSRKEVWKKTDNDSNQFITAKQAILLDFETGSVLYELNGNELCAPSSMTKLMTLYILFSEIKKGNIKLNDEFQVSELAQQQEGSRSFFKAGTMAKVEDLIRSIIVHSGNDACIIVAEGLFGDVSAFVKEMNEFSQIFGLKHSHFTNPMGLPDETHYSTVADLAKISLRLMKDFPQYYHYFAEKKFTVNGITQTNRNTLIGNSLGIDGLKTGYTNAGGYGIVVSASQNGRRLISVVNGCSNSAARVKDTNKLLAMGFREFVTYKVAKSGHPITEAKVWLGKKNTIEVCTGETVTVSIPKKLRDSLKIQADIKEPIEAPIKMGDRIGDLVYKYEGYESKKYPLFALESVERLSWWERMIFTVKALIFGATDSATIKNEPQAPRLQHLSINGREK